MCLVKPLIYGHIGSSRVNEMDMGEEAMVQKKLQKKDTSNLKLRRCFAGRKLRKLPGISKSTGVTQQ